VIHDLTGDVIQDVSCLWFKHDDPLPFCQPMKDDPKKTSDLRLDARDQSPKTCKELLAWLARESM